MSAADEHYLRGIAGLYGVKDPPSVDVVEEVGPMRQVERVVACMHESGWSDVHLENGGVRYPWDPDDPEQREAIGLALYTCYAKYPVRAELLHPSEEMYRRLYDYFRDELAPCLRSRGHDISPAPNWEYWLYAIANDREYWDPANEVPQDDYPEDACPRMPQEFR